MPLGKAQKNKKNGKGVGDNKTKNVNIHNERTST